ncbi:MAG: glycosyltransferase [Gammaproteobacteria bacterium]|nr:glycosyltransferase [Gammaproteobacteria bacterium]
MTITSPIVLFVYNRPWHTRRTIEALQKNELALNSVLFIYSDEAKDEDAREGVDEVRAYIDTIEGFKKVTVIERDKNWGLANSIIDGVTRVVSEYGRVIVLEDDIVTSPYFLKFMNEALDFYQNKSKVWHVSGWNCAIETDGLEDVFLWRLMNCWGWATWADRWEYYEKNVEKTIQEFSQQEIKQFNLDGVEDFWIQVIQNKQGRINTWAIFWYATIFKQQGLCLNPVQTFVENIGCDGSGEHCGSVDIYSNKLAVNLNKEIKFLSELNENKIALERIKLFYKRQYTLFISVIYKIVNKIINKFPIFKRGNKLWK